MACSICGKDAPLVLNTDDPQVQVCVRCHSQPARHGTRTDHPHARPLGQSARNRPRELNVVGELPPRLVEEDGWPLVATASEKSVARERSNPRISIEAAPIDRDERRIQRRRRRSTRWCTALLLLGISLFTAGAVLIGMSFRNDGQQLWNVGTPLALAGQGFFLVGLILQLDILWQQGNDTRNTLQRLDRYVASDTAMVVKSQEKDAAYTSSLGHRPESPQTERFLAELKQRLDLIGQGPLSQPRS